MGRKKALTEQESLLLWQETQSNKWTLKEAAELNSVKKGLTQATLSNYFKQYKEKAIQV